MKKKISKQKIIFIAYLGFFLFNIVLTNFDEFFIIPTIMILVGTFIYGSAIKNE